MTLLAHHASSSASPASAPASDPRIVAFRVPVSALEPAVAPESAEGARARDSFKQVRGVFGSARVCVLYVYS